MVLHHIVAMIGTGFGSMFLQPLEVVKFRMQLSGIGPDRKEFNMSAIDIAQRIIKNEGFLGLYKGYSAIIMKTTFFYIPSHSITCHLLTDESEELQQQIMKYYIPGFTVAFLATPAEVAQVRMSVDGRLPIEQRRNYRNVFHAWYRISTEEGILTLWRGATPSMSLSGLTMAVHIFRTGYGIRSPEDFLKDAIHRKYLEEAGAVACQSLISTTVSMPIDMAKTRLQNMRNINGKPEYSGGRHVIREVIKREGIIYLWKGFLPNFIRILIFSVFSRFILADWCAVGKDEHCTLEE